MKLTEDDMIAAMARAMAEVEVPPVSWTPEHLCSRSPPWPESTHLTRRSSGVR